MSFAKQHEQKPQDILGDPAVRRLLVRRVANRDDHLADALFDIAASAKTDWELREWNQVLDRLDSSNETIGRWLNRHS